MGAHLEPVPSGAPEGELEPFGDDDPFGDDPDASYGTLARPPWWRAVAVVVVVAMVVATPFAYALFVILR